MRLLVAAIVLSGCSVPVDHPSSVDASVDASADVVVESGVIESSADSSLTSVDPDASVVDETVSDSSDASSQDGALPCCKAIGPPIETQLGDCASCRWCDDAAHIACHRDQ